MRCSFHITLSPCPSTYGLAKSEALERLSTRLGEGVHLCRNICMAQHCTASHGKDAQAQNPTQTCPGPAKLRCRTSPTAAAASTNPSPRSLCAARLKTQQFASKDPLARVSQDDAASKFEPHRLPQHCCRPDLCICLHVCLKVRALCSSMKISPMVLKAME